MANQASTLGDQPGRRHTTPLYPELEIDQEETIDRATQPPLDTQKPAPRQRGFLDMRQQRFAHALGWFSIGLVPNSAYCSKQGKQIGGREQPERFAAHSRHTRNRHRCGHPYAA